MDFRILGPFEVLEAGRALDVGGGKQRAVLALLLLHPNEIVSSHRLIQELWPNEPPPSASKIIQVHVSRLRKALDGVGEGILLTRGHGYLLRVQPGQLDRDRFHGLIEEGRVALARDDPDGAAETLRAALMLWRGPPLADFEPLSSMVPYVNFKFAVALRRNVTGYVPDPSGPINESFATVGFASR